MLNMHCSLKTSNISLVGLTMAPTNSPTLARMVQPRVMPASGGGQIRPGSSDKPSVIVVQKGPGGKAILTKVSWIVFGEMVGTP
jgi:hypothetical protein